MVDPINDNSTVTFESRLCFESSRDAKFQQWRCREERDPLHYPTPSLADRRATDKLTMTDERTVERGAVTVTISYFYICNFSPPCKIRPHNRALAGLNALNDDEM